MKRMYYLTDNLDSTEQISNDIHQAGVTDWNFHVISKDEAGLYQRRIHAANLIQTQDIIRYGERGAILGLAVAVPVTLWVMAGEPFGSGAGVLAYASIFGVITLFGAWVGGLAGLATENQAIAGYHDALDAGSYLILIDVKAEQTETIRRLMAERHPEARLMRIGSTLVNPFEMTEARTA